MKKNLRVAMLTAHALTPEALKRSFEMKARTFLPKEKLGEVVPFLKDVLKYEYLPGWKRHMKKLDKYFKARWGTYTDGILEGFRNYMAYKDRSDSYKDGIE